ncbi:MAG: phage tail length tape measure family protein, partial [Burkholderiales bacterium]|nr:phage tail length tape measure family protein [Burkholderiales bacterium]
MATDNRAIIKIQAEDATRAAFASVARSIASLTTRLGPMQAILGTTATALAGSFAVAAREAKEFQDRFAQVDAVLRATGYASGQTAADLAGIVAQIRSGSPLSRAEIVDAANELLRFRDIGGEAFRDTMQAAVEFSTVFGGSLQQAVGMFGRALQDPIKGMEQLEKAGVGFTAAQRDQIKALAEGNKHLDAQRALLGAVRGQLRPISQEINEKLLKGTHDLSRSWGQLLDTFNRSNVAAGSVDALVRSIGRGIEALDRADLRLTQAGAQALARGDPNRARTIGDLRALEEKLMDDVRAAQKGMADAEAARLKAKKDAEDKVKKAERDLLGEQQLRRINQIIEGYTREIQGIQKLSEEQRVLQDIVAGRYLFTTRAQQESLLQAARQVDAAHAEKAAAEEQAAAQKHYAQVREETNESLRVAAERLRDLVDPTREATRALEELDRVQSSASNPLSATEEAAARTRLEFERFKQSQQGIAEAMLRAADPTRALNQEIKEIEEALSKGLVKDPGDALLLRERIVALRRELQNANLNSDVEALRDRIDPTRRVQAQLDQLQDWLAKGEIFQSEFDKMRTLLEGDMRDAVRG